MESILSKPKLAVEAEEKAFEDIGRGVSADTLDDFALPMNDNLFFLSVFVAVDLLVELL